MGINEMGVDEVGVDEMGSRRSGTTPLFTGSLNNITNIKKKFLMLIFRVRIF